MLGARLRRGAGLLCALTLAGCGGGGGGGATGTVPPLASASTAVTPESTPPTTSEPTPTGSSIAPATSTAAPTGRPTAPESREPPPAGAQAFPATEQGALDLVKAVYAAAGQAISSNETERFRSLVATYCNCLDLATSAEARAKRGERVTGAGYLKLQVKDFVRAGDFATVSVFYELARGEGRSSDGKIVAVSPARGQFQDAVTLERRANGWLVTHIGNLTKGQVRK